MPLPTFDYAQCLGCTQSAANRLQNHGEQYYGFEHWPQVCFILGDDVDVLFVNFITAAHHLLANLLSTEASYV